MPFRPMLAVCAFLMLALTSCSLFDSGGCPTEEIPSAPILIEVTQDLQTLRATAIVEDTSDIEQWIVLERAFISSFNRTSVVGTSETSIDREELPLNRETGRRISIVDRGITQQGTEVLEPGRRYGYTARAWNCYGWSEESNNITVEGIQPTS